MAIMRAAAELFYVQGFAATGIDAIASSVGVTGRAIYRHFRSKDDLLTAVISHTVNEMLTCVGDAASTTDDDVEAMVGAMVRHAVEQPAWLGTYFRERNRLTPEAVGVIAPSEHQLFETWRRAIRRSLPAVDDIRLRVRSEGVIGVLGGAQSHRTSVAGSRRIDLLTKGCTDMVLVPMVLEVPSSEVGDQWHAPLGKRDVILSAALRLFRDRGIEGVGVDEIGTAAGISGPTIYHYFNSKADLVLQAADLAGERVSVGVEQALMGAKTAHDALERMTRSYVAVASDNVDLMVVTSRSADTMPAPDRPRFVRRRDKVRTTWFAALRDSRPDLRPEEVRFLIAAVEPLMNHAVQAAERFRQPLNEEIVAMTMAFLGSTRAFDSNGDSV